MLSAPVLGRNQGRNTGVVGLWATGTKIIHYFLLKISQSNFHADVHALR